MWDEKSGEGEGRGGGGGEGCHKWKWKSLRLSPLSEYGTYTYAVLFAYVRVYLLLSGVKGTVLHEEKAPHTVFQLLFNLEKKPCISSSFKYPDVGHVKSFA